jgi:hypothetical protein
MQSGPALSSPRSDRLLLALLDRFGDDEAIDIGHARISTGERILDLRLDELTRAE